MTTAFRKLPTMDMMAGQMGAPQMPSSAGITDQPDDLYRLVSAVKLHAVRSRGFILAPSHHLGPARILGLLQPLTPFSCSRSCKTGSSAWRRRTRRTASG